ncbi:hypothetical protein BURKHO8Y_30034 [Burkholderia sp. 8Y]|uniref:hypothetical protein n=1 Tax=Burkholderia sp. 8Y TaxID=2653133 RepID=UPI0012EF8ACA|nr:hypothetical protein [Burkholderia sp. 8Y]VXC69031.1 hypothetical protein BURKHO8Y_30034 [Burkholderia sp. 8Y]
MLSGVYKPVDYGNSETLRLKAQRRLEKTDAMNKVLHAMLDNGADQEKHWQGRIERIDAQRRQHGFIK